MDEVKIMRKVIELLKCSEDEVVQKTLALKKRFLSMKRNLEEIEAYLKLLER